MDKPSFTLVLPSLTLVSHTMYPYVENLPISPRSVSLEVALLNPRVKIFLKITLDNENLKNLVYIFAASLSTKCIQCVSLPRKAASWTPLFLLIL